MFDPYHFLVEGLLHFPENSKKDLSQDGDPQVFQQLLIEDNYELKLIDLTLPNQFSVDSGLNAKYKSLRPYMINMYRRMLEKTSKYMEGCVLYANNDNLGGEGDDSAGVGVSGGPHLLVESANSYFSKSKE